MDGARVVLILLDGESLRLRILEQLVRVLRMQRGQDGEEVLPIAAPAFGVLIRKVFLHERQLQTSYVEGTNADLIVLRRVEVDDLIGLQQFLLAL